MSTATVSRQGGPDSRRTHGPGTFSAFIFGNGTRVQLIKIGFDSKSGGGNFIFFLPTSTKMAPDVYSPGVAELEEALRRAADREDALAARVRELEAQIDKRNSSCEYLQKRNLSLERHVKALEQDAKRMSHLLSDQVLLLVYGDRPCLHHTFTCLNRAWSATFM